MGSPDTAQIDGVQDDSGGTEVVHFLRARRAGLGTSVRAVGRGQGFMEGRAGRRPMQGTWARSLVWEDSTAAEQLALCATGREQRLLAETRESHAQQQTPRATKN